MWANNLERRRGKGLSWEYLLEHIGALVGADEQILRECDSPPLGGDQQYKQIRTNAFALTTRSHLPRSGGVAA